MTSAVSIRRATAARVAAGPATTVARLPKCSAALFVSIVARRRSSSESAMPKNVAVPGSDAAAPPGGQRRSSGGKGDVELVYPAAVLATHNSVKREGEQDRMRNN